MIIDSDEYKIVTQDDVVDDTSIHFVKSKSSKALSNASDDERVHSDPENKHGPQTQDI